MSKYEFEIYGTTAKGFRWRFWSPNYKIIASSSEAYNTKTGAEGGRDLVKTGSGTYTVYQDNAGEYRWHFTGWNSKIIATSGEGYKNRSDCESGRDAVKNNAPLASTRYSEQ